jgi:hypothetical protein
MEMLGRDSGIRPMRSSGLQGSACRVLAGLRLLVWLKDSTGGSFKDGLYEETIRSESGALVAHLCRA